MAGEKSEGGFKRPRGPAAARLWLLAFGSLLVVLFIVLGITEGVGHPSVPSGHVAVIEDAPEGLGTISEGDFKRALEATAARAQVKPVPKPGEAKYEELLETALGERLDSIWIQGQAEEMEIEASDTEVAEELKKAKDENFESEAEYKKYLTEQHLTQADIEEQVKAGILGRKIQEQVTSANSLLPSKAEVEDYYEAAKAGEYTREEKREVRVLTFKDDGDAKKAKAKLERDDSVASWKRVGATSNDPVAKRTGGLLNEGAESEGVAKEHLRAALFAAPQGEVEGPLRTGEGYVVFEVMAITPEKVTGLEEAEPSINNKLRETAQQQSLTSFVADFYARWTSRTFCAAGFVIEHCANFKGSGHPGDAAPACYEANPKGGLPETGCPAPVVQTKPALPGSVTPLTPEGQRLAQRPHPAVRDPSAVFPE